MGYSFTGRRPIGRGKLIHVNRGHALTCNAQPGRDDLPVVGKLLFEIEENGTLTKREMLPGEAVMTPKTVHRMTAIETPTSLVSTPELRRRPPRTTTTAKDKK